MRVLVTRPEPGATATAGRLSALGHEPVVLPLTRTLAIPTTEMPDRDAFDAVVATSAAAIRHAPAELIAAIAHLPLHTIGMRGAELARAGGFANIGASAIDADALATALPGRLAAGSRLLYLAGRLRTGALAMRLQASGFRVSTLEVYDTIADETAFTDAPGRIGAKSIDAALVYSAYAAAMLTRLAGRPEFVDALSAARLLCLSARVADALGGDVAGRVEVAARPDETALLALLARVR